MTPEIKEEWLLTDKEIQDAIIDHNRKKHKIVAGWIPIITPRDSVLTEAAVVKAYPLIRAGTLREVLTKLKPLSAEEISKVVYGTTGAANVGIGHHRKLSQATVESIKREIESLKSGKLE